MISRLFRPAKRFQVISEAAACRPADIFSGGKPIERYGEPWLSEMIPVNEQQMRDHGTFDLPLKNLRPVSKVLRLLNFCSNELQASPLL